jgi:hypothetical protein
MTSAYNYREDSVNSKFSIKKFYVLCATILCLKVGGNEKEGGLGN